MEKNLAKLDEVILLDAKRQRFPVLRFAFELRLSHDMGWQPEVRDAAVAVAESYWRDTKPATNSYLRMGASRYSSIKNEDFIDHYRERLAARRTSADDGAMRLIDGSDGKPPAQHQFSWTEGFAPEPGEAPGPRQRSNLSATWPIARVTKNSAQMIALIGSWCSLLKVEQGSAGIAPIAEFGILRNRFAEYIPFLKRFPGLDFAWPLFEAPLWGGLRAVNWLTVLGDRYVEAMGGRAALQLMVSDDVTLHDFDGGVIIQAGPLPEMGDINHNLWPETLRHVNAVLRPLRFEDIPNLPSHLIKVPEPMDPYIETLNWIRRFDRS